MHENEGSVSVAVSVLLGTLGRDVIVSLNTINGTAVGRSPGISLINLENFVTFYFIPQCSWDRFLQHLP